MRRFTVAALGPEPPTERPPVGEETAAMKRHWNRWLDQVLPAAPDLIVLHECCDRFPAMPLADRLACYREHGEQMADIFRQKAVDNHCAIAYSAVRALPDGTLRNSTRLFDRNGNVISFYDKNFPMIEETLEQGILPGREETVVETEFGRVGFAICFDLNFDALRLRYVKRNVDLMLFSSMYHGGLMQAYWAYSNRCYFIAAVSGGGKKCAVVNPVGTTIAESTNYYPWLTCNVNTDFEVVHLDGNFDKLQTLRKAYGRAVTVTDPGYLGSVLITSETAETTAAEMVRQFEIERLDDYFGRVMAFRCDHCQ
jgi:predicted amidohydrolase